MAKNISIIGLILFILFSSSVSAKKYKILFDKNCSYLEAIQVLRSLETNYEMISSNIKNGVVSFYVEKMPDCAQLNLLLEKSENIVAFCVSLPNQQAEWKEAYIKQEAKDKKIAEEEVKIPEYFNWYRFSAEYLVKADAKKELDLAKSIFNIEKASFNKEANEVIVKIEDSKWTAFLKEINECKKVLSAKEVVD